MKGVWKTRNFKTAFLCFHAKELMKLFKNVKFVLIRRKKNLHAAMLAHESINNHLNREAFAKFQCDHMKRKRVDDKKKKEDDEDKTDFDDEYYEYK